ncbi:MAG: hypothetical protein R3183_08430 [Oleiphilaceae bacterium]|nr:hypothetical protein [Oleiphilaceae bacterium]
MKQFLRQNPTIAFGLGLPLLLVIAFALATGIPSLLVAPPKYDVLYATDYHHYQHGVQISVIDEKVQLRYVGAEQTTQKPRIWRFDPGTDAVKEITYLLPPVSDAPSHLDQAAHKTKPTPIVVPELESLRVDASSIAPDGYEFMTAERYQPHFFGSLFYSSRYRADALLSKQGRSIRLPHTQGRYYRGNTHFIGWVVSP